MTAPTPERVGKATAAAVKAFCVDVGLDARVAADVDRAVAALVWAHPNGLELSPAEPAKDETMGFLK